MIKRSIRDTMVLCIVRIMAVLEIISAPTRIPASLKLISTETPYLVLNPNMIKSE